MSDRPVMLSRHSALRPALLLLLLSVGLVACGGKGDDNEAAPSPSPKAPISAPAPAPAPPAGTQAAPELPVFTPTAAEVREAMQQILVQKAMTMPPSQQRDAWFAAESQRFSAIQVGKCTTAPLGTPSTCHISVGGKTTQIKILLTRAGWMLVK